MSLRYIDSDGNEQFIAGGGGGSADIIPLKKSEFDMKFEKGELEEGKYYAITDDVDKDTIEEQIQDISTKVDIVDSLIKTDEETLPVGSGTVYGAVNALHNTIGEGTLDIGNDIIDGINDLNNKLDERGKTTSHGKQTRDVPTGAFVTTDSIDLSKGTYLVTVDADYGTDTTVGTRILLIDETETTSNTATNSVLATGRACLNKSRIIELNKTTTFYMRVYQATGKTLSVESRLNVVRLA